MARPRDPNRDQAKQIWLDHGSNITNRQIAEQLDIDEKKIAVLTRDVMRTEISLRLMKYMSEMGAVLKDNLK